MKTLKQSSSVIFIIFLLSLLLPACGPAAAPSASTAAKPTVPAVQPTLAIEDTSIAEFAVPSFASVHKPVDGDPNKGLILGNIVIKPAAPDLPADLAPFLGRWEGFNFAPPIKKDRKDVIAIQEVTPSGGTAYAWSGTNLQFPDIVQEIHFRFTNGVNGPRLEWRFALPNGPMQYVSFTYDKEKDQLTGWIEAPELKLTDGPHILTRAKDFYVYQDYPAYLKSKRIEPHEFKNPELAKLSAGYMLYLPEGYEQNPDKKWPLIYFLHGAGDRGSNLLILPKASPLAYIREKGPLPAIIAAPLLTADPAIETFPIEFLDGALAEIRSQYRVDAKSIYLTGLSLGGEASWRLALHQPDTFAAAAILCGWLNPRDTKGMDAIKNLPVWAIHGADDTIIPLVWGQHPVDALKAAGGDVRFDILPGHDHDVWTDTYVDPALYEWMLSKHRP
jgi:pimeloyl-ACP methyl ester carboxylesterase